MFRRIIQHLTTFDMAVLSLVLWALVIHLVAGWL